MRRSPRSLAVAASVAALASAAAAHERDFTLSRDWHLPYKGENEIESRTFWNPRPNDLTQQVEYEYGITDHVAVEPGLTFNKRNADSFELEGADVELRFNLRDFGFDKFLPAFNVEYEHRIEDDKVPAGVEEEPKNAVELRGILSYYTERGEDFTINLNVGRGFGEGESEWESEFTAGYLRRLDFIPGITPSKEHPINVGLEFTQQLSKEHFGGAGPVVTWRATRNLHVLGTVLFGFNKRDENFDQLRLILEWEF